MRILKTKYYGISDWWNFGVGSKPLKDKLVETMNKGSEEKKNQSVSPMVEKRDELLRKRDGVKKDMQSAEFEKGRIQWELEGGKDPSGFSAENKKLFEQAEHNIDFNKKLYDELTREADLLDSKINIANDPTMQSRANKNFEGKVSSRPNYKKIEEFIQDYENDVKNGMKKNPEVEKLIQNLKRNRNLTRAGMIGIPTALIGTGVAYAVNRYKNKKENKA